MGKIFHPGYDDPKSLERAASERHGRRLRAAREQAAHGRQARPRPKRTERKARKARRAGSRGEPFEMADVPDNAYHDGSLADMAVAKLKELKAQGAAVLSGRRLLKPHLPFNSPKKYWDLYDPAKLKLADNPFRPKDAPPYAVTDFGELRNYYGVPPDRPGLRRAGPQADSRLSRRDAASPTRTSAACWTSSTGWACATTRSSSCGAITAGSWASTPAGASTATWRTTPTPR